MFSFLKKLFGFGNNDALIAILKEGACLVDVRTPQEFSTGSVKGAINIPLDKLQSQLSKLKNQKNIVVFCRSGSRSSMAKSILTQNGFANVSNGGTWQKVNQLLNN